MANLSPFRAVDGMARISISGSCWGRSCGVSQVWRDCICFPISGLHACLKAVPKAPVPMIPRCGRVMYFCL